MLGSSLHKFDVLTPHSVPVVALPALLRICFQILLLGILGILVTYADYDLGFNASVLLFKSLQVFVQGVC